MSHDDEPLGGVEALRGRLHKIGDMVTVHEGTLARHEIVIGQLSSGLSDLRETAATKEQLQYAQHTVTADIKALSVQLDLKLDKITDAVDTLQSGGKWLILLVVGAVVAAILELVIK
jgi:uncharacterized protein YigA (DUF484 family)